MSYLPPLGSDAFALLNIIADPDKSQARLKELVELQTSATKQLDDLRQAQTELDSAKADLERAKEQFYQEREDFRREMTMSNLTLEIDQKEASEKRENAIEVKNKYQTLIDELLPQLNKREADLSTKASNVSLREKAVSELEQEVSKQKSAVDKYISQVRALSPEF